MPRAKHRGASSSAPRDGVCIALAAAPAHDDALSRGRGGCAHVERLELGSGSVEDLVVV